MPLRVRCRCGQELTLRYSEWVYVFLAVALVALLLNTVALVLLYFRIEGLGGTAVSSGPSAPSIVLAAHSDEETKSLIPRPQADPARLPGEVASSPPPATAPGVPVPLEVEAPAPQPVPTVDGSILSVDNDLKQVLKAAESNPPTQPFNAPWVEDGTLVRLHLLESILGESAPLVLAALLLDSDSRLQRRALERLLEHTADGDSGAWAKQAAEMDAVLGPRAAWLEKVPGGDEILRRVNAHRVGGSASEVLGTDARSSDLPGVLPGIQKACSLWLSRADTEALRRHVELAASQGIDLVLAVDVSQSMSGALEVLQREALWLLPALTWALPGIRVGAIFYRDAVEKTLDFSSASETEILRELREARAEGGGDVPEGVHRALEAALSLGKFHWRESARKNIVLVGDAPPPHESKAGLLALLRQARLQGQFRVHTLGVNPEEGRSSVPMFPEISQAGGGRSVTITDPTQVGSELLLCAMADDAQPSTRVLLPALKRLFQPDLPWQAPVPWR